MNTRRIVSFLLGASLVTTAVAQDPVTPVRIDQDRFVPIHTHLSGPAGGIWAAGNAYKVRLDGGFEFIPALGPTAPVNLPLRWSTESVRLGGTELVSGEATERRVHDARYEYDLGDVVEAYDLRHDDVEQTFVIETRARGGALTVRGSVDSPLHADARPPAHGPIAFQDDDGNTVVEYGAATVIDARGRAFPMLSSYEAGSIELTLDAASVAAAEFPIVVDPTLVVGLPLDDIGEVVLAVLQQTTSANYRNHMVAFTRIFSASDHDVLGYTYFEGVSNAVVVLADVTTAYSNEHIAISGLDTPGRFVVTAEQRQGFKTHLWMYGQPATVPTLNQGSTHTVIASTGEHYRNPASGGDRDDTDVCIVYDFIQGSSRTIDALLYDPGHPSSHTPLPTIRTTSQELAPAITPYAGTHGWIVAWADQGSPSQVLVRQVFKSGSQGAIVFGVASSSNNHYFEPRIAGQDGRYMVTARGVPIGLGALAIRSLRIDWDQTPLQPTVPQVRSERLVHVGESYTNRSLAFDEVTRSHWEAGFDHTVSLFAVTTRAARLGFSGGTVDTIAPDEGAHQNPQSVSVAFNRSVSGGTLGFSLAYFTRDTLNGVYGVIHRYSPTSWNPTTFGAGCGGASTLENWTPSLAGSQEFSGTLLGHAGQLAACVVGPASTTIPLDALGMPSCFYLVDPAGSVSVPGVGDGSGNPTLTMSLPDYPAFLGDLHTQWLIVQPGANPLGVITAASRIHDVQ